MKTVEVAWLQSDAQDGNSEVSPNQHRNHNQPCCVKARGLFAAYSGYELLEIAKNQVTRQLTAKEKEKYGVLDWQYVAK